jgi:hypothetical protein
MFASLPFSPLSVYLIRLIKMFGERNTDFVHDISISAWRNLLSGLFAFKFLSRYLCRCSIYVCNLTIHWTLSLFLSSVYSLSPQRATARGGLRPPSRVSSIPPGLGRPISSFYIPALPHPPPLHLPNAAWVSLWGDFLLARWGLSWINHRHPSVWHVLPISVYSVCRSSQFINIHSYILSFIFSHSVLHLFGTTNVNVSIPFIVHESKSRY